MFVRPTPRTVGVLFVPLALGLGLATGCASRPSPATTPAAAEAAPLAISDGAWARADGLLGVATTVEPDLTALLVSGAARLDVHLRGLEFRVKSRDSLARKIQTEMLASGRPADEIEINDVLRYTVLLDDRPAGDYKATAAEILRRADEQGEKFSALLTTAEGGSAWTLAHPEYGVVLPVRPPPQIPLVLPVAGQDAELVRYLNVWIAYQRSRGVVDDYFDHWIRGGALEEKEPRWSIGRTVLGWW